MRPQVKAADEKQGGCGTLYTRLAVFQGVETGQMVKHSQSGKAIAWLKREVTRDLQQEKI